MAGCCDCCLRTLVYSAPKVTYQADAPPRDEWLRTELYRWHSKCQTGELTTPSPCLAIADSLFAWVFNPDQSCLLTDTLLFIMPHRSGHTSLFSPLSNRSTAQRASPVRLRTLWAASAIARVAPFAPIELPAALPPTAQTNENAH